MPTFEWKGTARNGQTQTGVLVADTKDAVIAAMRRQQIVVTAVKEKGKEGVVPAATKAAVTPARRRQQIVAPAVKKKGKETAVPKSAAKVPPQLVAIFT